MACWFFDILKMSFGIFKKNWLRKRAPPPTPLPLFSLLSCIKVVLYSFYHKSIPISAYSYGCLYVKIIFHYAKIHTHTDQNRALFYCTYPVISFWPFGQRNSLYIIIQSVSVYRVASALLCYVYMYYNLNDWIYNKNKEHRNYLLICYFYSWFGIVTTNLKKQNVLISWFLCGQTHAALNQIHF